MSHPGNAVHGVNSGTTVRDARRLNLIGESDAFGRAVGLIEKIAACDATRGFEADGIAARIVEEVVEASPPLCACLPDIAPSGPFKRALVGC